jgi:hypothetical protein
MMVMRSIARRLGDVWLVLPRSPAHRSPGLLVRQGRKGPAMPAGTRTAGHDAIRGDTRLPTPSSRQALITHPPGATARRTCADKVLGKIRDQTPGIFAASKLVRTRAPSSSAPYDAQVDADPVRL